MNGGGSSDSGWTNCPLCGGAAQYGQSGLCHACGFLWVSADAVTTTSLDELTRTAHATGDPLKPPSAEHREAVRRN